MTTIMVYYSLVERRQTGDKQLERRVWLADRIRRLAPDSLGPRFVGVEMVSKPDVPGPSMAVFLFEPLAGTDRRADDAHQQQVVKKFVDSLGRP